MPRRPELIQEGASRPARLQRDLLRRTRQFGGCQPVVYRTLPPYAARAGSGVARQRGAAHGRVSIVCLGRIEAMRIKARQLYVPLVSLLPPLPLSQTERTNGTAVTHVGNADDGHMRIQHRAVVHSCNARHTASVRLIVARRAR